MGKLAHGAKTRFPALPLSRSTEQDCMAASWVKVAGPSKCHCSNRASGFLGFSCHWPPRDFMYSAGRIAYRQVIAPQLRWIMRRTCRGRRWGGIALGPSPLPPCPALTPRLLFLYLWQLCQPDNLLFLKMYDKNAYGALIACAPWL